MHLPPPIRAATCAFMVLLVAGCTAAGDDPEQVATVTDGDVDAAGEAAGCVVDAPGFAGDTSHVPPDEAPPVEDLYERRPSIGGPHFSEWLAAGVFDHPVEERAAVHNLEHGAVALWYDPALDEGEVAALTAWATSRNQAGLLDERTGAGLIVAPYDGPLDAPIALRAWGVAADCERFDETFADGFVVRHFGPAGDAPEGHLGVDPSEVIGSPDPDAIGT